MRSLESRLAVFDGIKRLLCVLGLFFQNVIAIPLPPLDPQEKWRRKQNTTSSDWTLKFILQVSFSQVHYLFFFS